MSSYQKKYICHCLGATILSLFLATPAFALDIIPGLKGFGTDTRAAYGAANTPEICIVDSLLTTAGNPTWDASTYSVGVFKGTLIQCLEGLDTLNGETIDGHVVLPNSGKIILFEVSGTIRQQAAHDDDKTFRYNIGSYTTIAGQTSPEPGVLFRNICMFGGGVNDVLIQHVRGRMDGPPTTKFGLHKSFTFATGTTTSVYNIVIDHVSCAWGADAQLAFYHGWNATGEFKNITVSNTIISEARENMGLTDEEANNGKNILVGTTNGTLVENIFIYGNLISNTKKRNPQIKNATALLVNNYIYNNRDTTATCVFTTRPSVCSLVGNVTEGGPMLLASFASDYIVNLGLQDWATPVSQHSVYLYDNKCDLGTQTSSTDWSRVDSRPGNTTAYGNEADFKVTGEDPPNDSPLWITGLTVLPSTAVKASIIANAGAYPAFRDSLDTRFISEMTNSTGPSSSVKGAPSSGDWPTLTTNKIKLAIPPNPHADDDRDGYTNLEEWLHSQAAIVEGKSPLSPLPPVSPLPPKNLKTIQ
ncbi:MAG: hypothetical protein K8R16_08295 [Anaerolineales bacterium]|nr:hypothetical protein [Anaerolineales bacterium]